MRGRVVLLLVLLVVVVAVAVGAFLLSSGGDGDDVADEPTQEPGMPTVPGEPGDVDNPTPEPVVIPEVQTAQVVIALQDLPRGLILDENLLYGSPPAVDVRLWPINSIPDTAFASVEELEGLLTRTDIPRESPIVAAQLVSDPLDIGATGSDAALLIDPGNVAISIPFDQTGIGSVGFAPQPGDYVDVIMSFLFIEVDETFQTRQPNLISVITRDESGQLVFSAPLEGRAEPSPLSALGVLIIPSEQQRPRLVTQMTVTGAKVIYVGFFPPDGEILGLRTATPTIFSTPTPGGEDAQQAPPTAIPPTATPYSPRVITLGVSRQDALVLTWGVDAQIPMMLALRSATDDRNVTVPTTAVTLQYLIETYDITQPQILPFALEPGITSLRNASPDIFETFGGGGQETQP